MFKKNKIKNLIKLLESESRQNHLIAFEIILSNKIIISDDLGEHLKEFPDLCVKFGPPFTDLLDGIETHRGFADLVRSINMNNKESAHSEEKIEETNQHNNNLLEYCLDNVRGNTSDGIKAMVLKSKEDVIEL